MNLKESTIKLGCNELGFNEQKQTFIWFVKVIFMMVLPDYNEQIPVITNTILFKLLI